MSPAWYDIRHMQGPAQQSHGLERRPLQSVALIDCIALRTLFADITSLNSSCRVSTGLRQPDLPAHLSF